MFKKIVCMIICCCTVVGLLIQSIENIVFDAKNYQEEYEKYDLYGHIGISKEDLDHATDILIDYMDGQRLDMVAYGTVKGQEREIFNDREKAHMVDVNHLIHMSIRFKLISFVSFFIMMCAIAYYRKKQGLHAIARIFLKSYGIVMVLLGIVLVFAAIDFDSFWIKFHEVLFTNDLWLLDERTSIMINMMPLEFFEDFVKKIVMYYVGYSVVALSVATYLNSKTFLNRITHH